MFTLPVLDLKQGVVVRGIAGNRDSYRPVESRLAEDSRPATVARAFVEKLGLREAYVADLDAIAGAEPDWEAYRAISAAGLSLWIDAGVRNRRRATVLAAFSMESQSLKRIIVGLESCDSPARLRETLAAVGSDRAVFSLDLKQGQPLLAPGSQGWMSMSPLEIAATAVHQGVAGMIVLDLSRVGMDGGVGTEYLCEAIHHRWPSLDIVGGGGIRSLADMQSVCRAGCSGVLVASALHDGRLGKDDLAEAASWEPSR